MAVWRYNLALRGCSSRRANRRGALPAARLPFRLNKHSGMSYGKIADLFQQANGMDLQHSTATRIVLRAAQQLRPTYAEIQESLQDSAYITADETGWRQGGRPVWLHAWVGDQATCYVIDPHRSADALEKVIGLNYSGTLIRDGAATYDRFQEALHQLCVDHALRRAHKLEEWHSGRAGVFPQQVIDLLTEALAVRDDFRVRLPALEERDAAYQDYVARLCRLSVRRRGNEDNDIFAAHLYAYAEGWFTFLLEPARPATNHQAEQALRTPIVNRKVFGGNGTAAGCQAQVILSSTIQSCKQQQRSAFGFLRDAMCGVVRSIFQAATGASPIP